MKVLWYIGNKKEESSLTILYRNINKYSSFEWIPFSSAEEAYKLDGDILIGTTRIFNDTNFSKKLQEKFKCFLFIHGIGKLEIDHSILIQNYSKFDHIPKLVSSKYIYNILKKCRIESTIIPFGYNPEQFLYKERTHNNLIFGMCFQKRKAHRKGWDLYPKMKKKGFNVKTALDIPHKDIHSFFQNVDVFVNASPDDGRETFCLPLLEAAACGCMIITTPVGVSQEIIENDGVLCNKNEIISEMENVSKLGLPLIRENGKSIYTRVNNNWSWESTIKIWESVLCVV